MAMDSLVSWAFLSGILQFHGTWSSVGKKMVTFDKTCLPTDCTQPAFQDGFPTFPCAIGMQSACDAAVVKYKTDTPAVAFYSFALLATVGTYMRQYEDKKVKENPSLNFSLTTPYGGEESLKTKAIQVNFHSPKGFGGDEFYRKNPRCRIFDFSNATRQPYDIQHPREIQYDCFVGLSIANVMTYYYQMKLTSYPSHATTDYSIVVHNEPRDPKKKYQIVIAVAAIAVRRSVHVVWERPLPMFKIKSYVVTLSERGKVLHTQSRPYGDEKWEFLKLSPGDFTVKVESKIANGSSPFAATASRSLRLIYIADITDSSPSLSLKTVLAAVTGVVIAVILLMIFLILYRKRCPRTCPEPELDRVLIVNHRSDAGKVSRLSPVISKVLGMEVDYKQGDLCNITPTGLAKWFEAAAKNPKIVVICSAEAANLARNREEKNYSHEFFCKALTQIIECPSLSKKVWFACMDINQHEHIDIFQSGKKSKSGRIRSLKCALFDTQSKQSRVYCLPDDFTELGEKLKKGNVSEKYKQDTDWKRFLEEFVDVREYTNWGNLGQNSSSLSSFICQSSSDMSLSEDDSASQTRFRLRKAGQTLIPRHDFQSLSSIDSTEEQTQELTPEDFIPSRKQSSKGESDLWNKESSSTTEIVQHNAPHFKKKKSKPYKYLTSLREEELDKSCVTLLSGDIPVGEGEVEENPESVTSNTSGPLSSHLSGQRDHQYLEYASHLPAQSQRYERIMPQSRHASIPGHQSQNCDSQEPLMVHNIRNLPPGASHNVSAFGHHRNSEVGEDRYCEPHPIGQQVSVDSGHFEDASGTFRSDIDGSLPMSGQGYMYGHGNPKMAIGAPVGVRPGHAFRQERSLADHPVSLNQNQLYNRQASIDRGSVNEDDLYGSGISTPLLHKGHVSHRDTLLPQQISPLSPSETDSHPKRDTDSDTDRSAVVSFCSPDSDNGSYTNSSDGGYCIQQDESGELVIVPKHYSYHMTQREADFPEIKSAVMDSGLSSRHNSAPEDVAQQPMCSDSSTHNEEYMASEGYMLFQQNLPQGQHPTSEESAQRDSQSSSSSKMKTVPGQAHHFQKNSSSLSFPSTTKGKHLNTPKEEILGKSCVTLLSHDIATMEAENTQDSGFMSGSSLPFSSHLSGEKFHDQQYSSALPPQHYGGGMPVPYVTPGQYHHPGNMNVSLTRPLQKETLHLHHQNLNDAQLPACKEAWSDNQIHPDAVQGAHPMHNKGHLPGLDRSSKSRSPVTKILNKPEEMELHSLPGQVYHAGARPKTRISMKKH